MKKEEEKIVNLDSQKQFTKEDFTFVHEDKNEMIHDEAFKSKPTTFAKDAFKRFCKNKSSVVGAIIIGVLLLGSFIVPLVSPHNIKKVATELALLDPKVNKAGTGFWDGTVSYKNKPWDGSTENDDGTIGKPAGEFEWRAVVKKSVKVTDVIITNDITKTASGGYVFVTDNRPTLTDTNTYNTFINNFVPFSMYNLEDDPSVEEENKYKYKLNLEMANFDGADDLLYAGMKNTRVKIFFGYTAGEAWTDINKDADINKLNFEYIELTDDWSNLTGELEYDLTSVITANNIQTEDLKYCRIRIEGERKSKVYSSQSDYTYFALKDLVISCEHEVVDPEDEEEVAEYEAYKETFNDISINDANFMLNNTYADGSGTNPKKSIHYWISNGNRSVYHAEKRTVSFRYDPYEEVLGTRPSFPVGGTEMERLKRKGIIDFNELKDLHETFKILDKKKCPIVEVNGKGSYNVQYDAWQYDCKVVYYKYIGYSSMPHYILGTDGNGFDIFTKALNCLKTSLLVAIISSAICLAIGLVWGSISGYFGGNVDIVMERITDIISGVPWIVMMTLIILLLGNSIVTFAIALIMTGWISTASRTRTQFYRFKGREYVLASRTLGASDARLIFKHILPNSLGTIVTGSVLMIPGCIFSEASISYLGLGLKGVDSFGVLLSDNQQYLSTHPALIVFPAIIISLLMISFNLFGNGLRDALNPALKGEE